MTLRRTPLLAGLLALAMSLTLVASAQSATPGRPGGPSDVRLPDTSAVDARGSAGLPGSESGQFTGFDGIIYESAPPVVTGDDGELFYGPDFDFACGLGGRFRKAVDQLARLARLIERSGRRVVYTIAPDKSAVLPGFLDRAQLPHGRCDRLGFKAQNKILDNYADPSYLPLRRRLAATEHQAYWHTDPHWTSVGGSIFARALAQWLDPQLAKRQRYKYGTDTRIGMLNGMLGLGIPETSETATPHTRVTVRTKRGTEQWAGYPDYIADHSWVSTPAKRTWPGRTLVLGDSYAWYALENLRPLFHRGRFVWFTMTDLDKVARTMRKADTIVIEVVQVFTNGTVIGNKEFRNKVRRALS